MGLLTGVRVLAVEQYGAGPFGTQALADLGADVIKIENPRDGGDSARAVGPFFNDALGETSSSLFFQSINRNKRSVAVDLATGEGREVFRDLVRHADALACNLRGDVPARLGLTYESLKDIKPEFVCAHLSAYGRDGDRAKWPGYDYLIQAEAGYFPINGEPTAPPSRFGLSIIDFMAGYCMSLSLVSAVMNARATGRGRDVDVSLYDVGLANLNYLASWALNAGFEPERLPRSAHPSLVPCQLFRTKDSWIYVMANKERFFPVLCERLGKPELARDPRFLTFDERRANREILSNVLDDLFSARTTDEWMKALTGAVPVAAVSTMSAALSSDFTQQRGMIMELDSDKIAPGELRVVGSPFKTGDDAPHRAAPELGSDTETLLVEAGYGNERIGQLRKRGIIR
jgi:succinate--hydroxymethylglutarate CoA-transferase